MSRTLVALVFILCVSFSARAQDSTTLSAGAGETFVGIIETLRFKDADIGVVLQAIAQKAVKNGKKVNITSTADVHGAITVNLESVDWETALETVVKMGGYGYEWVGKERNIILVDTLESLAEQRAKAAEAKVAEPLETITYKLKFLDAIDVKNLFVNQLTPRGKITVLQFETQKGWKARGGYAAGSGSTGDNDFGRAEREKGARIRTNTLIITDTKTNINNIVAAIKEIDVMPKQVLIEAKIMEVSLDTIRDLGIDWGTGNSVDSGTLSAQSIHKKGDQSVRELGAIGLTSRNAPSVFGPKSSTLAGTWPFNGGTSLIYQKLSSTQFQILLHALEEDAKTNTLSSPRIITLDGQEAYIMVGERRPIIQSSISSSQTSVGISKNLNYYQNLGIELNVVPQVCDDKMINIMIYPSVTSSSQNTPATSQINDVTSTDYYPNILVRETQTQVLLEDGETIVIGGLLKDIKSEGMFKTPILGDIPILGKLFQRKTTDTEKIDLIIFITARIIDKDEERIIMAEAEKEQAQDQSSREDAAEEFSGQETVE